VELLGDREAETVPSRDSQARDREAETVPSRDSQAPGARLLAAPLLEH
jgi:hypothetical protein